MTDPVMLASKIAKRIASGELTSYSALEKRAYEIDVTPAVFLQAMTIIHRSKVIERTVKGDDIIYNVKVIKEPVVHTGAAWVTANYPWPGTGNIPVFEMPFPEIDMSWIVMSPDEAKEYKAKAKGMPMFMINKKHAKT